MVVKIGGDLLKDGIPDDLVEEIGVLSRDHSILLVHGGGDIVTEIAIQLGHPPRFVVSPKGFKSRYTDKKTAEIFTMVMAGKINKEIISAMQAKKVNAIGLSGLDGKVVQAKRKRQIIALNDKGRKTLMDGGYTGKVNKVNTGLLRLLLENGHVPVISALAIGEESEPLNVDGDRMAASVASALKADKLILLTDVPGVLKEGKPIPKLSVAEAEEFMEQIGTGMITKVYAATEAITSGVGEAIIGSGFIQGALAGVLDHTNGTVISR
jgi:acetylglutamate/LysW-gamma-L-alpha-aminoadipate kinase